MMGSVPRGINHLKPFGKRRTVLNKQCMPEITEIFFLEITLLHHIEKTYELLCLTLTQPLE